MAAAALGTGLFLCLNDLRARPPDLRSVERVLAVFPHPDDETVACGGTLHRLSARNLGVTLLVLTGGELGYRAGAPPGDLRAIRAAEVRRAASELGVTRVVQLRCPDGGLSSHPLALERLLRRFMDAERPDLVVTYDRAGLYGHPDHVACSRAVTAAVFSGPTGVRLWYATLPSRLRTALVALGALPRVRVQGRSAARPTVRVFVGTSLLAKWRARRTYASQRGALGAGAGRWLPAWVPVALQPFEYFEELERSSGSTAR
ncbi:MAG: PIG-L deacetylase family protein [Candidatus Dormibacteria bacterium]